MRCDLPVVALLALIATVENASSFLASAQPIAGGAGGPPPPPTVAGGADEQCMPMRDLTSISFQPTMTTGRRRSPNVPSMNCVGNCPSHVLTGAQCTQTGISDNGLPSWKCIGQFEGVQGQFGLSSVRVVCEGCSRAGDPNVALGSCSLQYGVSSFRRGLALNGHNHGGAYRRHSTVVHHHDGGDVFLATAVFIVIVSVVIGLCVFGCRSDRHSRPPYATAYPDGVPPVVGAPLGAPAAGYYPPHYGVAPAPYYGSSGLGTGMLMGYMMGSSWGHGGGYTTVNNYYDSGASDYDGGYSGGGGSDFSSGGGFGGSDSI